MRPAFIDKFEVMGEGQARLAQMLAELLA